MVSLKIDLGKKDFIWIGLVIVLIATGFAVATWDSSKAMFHNSEDVKVTIDAIDYSLQEALDGGLIGGSAGGMILGEWVSMGTSTATHTAATDGFAVAWGNGGHCGGGILGYTDSDSASLVEMQRSGSGYIDTARGGSITMPVKAGDDWKIGTTGCMAINAIYWIPIVSGGSTAGFIPESYSGEETIVFPNGMIIKTGYHAGGDGIQTVTFTTGAGIVDFSSAPVSIQLTPYGPDYHFGTPTVETSPAPSSSGFTVDINGGPYTGFYWTAIGR